METVLWDSRGLVVNWQDQSADNEVSGRQFRTAKSGPTCLMIQ
jgi:hypothetical protein